MGGVVGGWGVMEEVVVVVSCLIVVNTATLLSPGLLPPSADDAQSP